jgi:glycosyltransferase involved in cell wall biosynthesis
MKRIALIPVYNEASTLAEVLRAVSSQVDWIIVVDDGSTDGSGEMAQRWAQGGHGEVLRLHANRGMSAALRAGFQRLAWRMNEGELQPDDLLFTIDADGQHDPRQIAELGGYVEAHDLDVALTRRDFSLYPFHKRVGNSLMSAWGSIWGGFRYRDVESGFRAMRLKVLPHLLDYYTGYRYSCAQEIAILTARLGFRIDNDFNTAIRLYRSQTGVGDVVINGVLGMLAFARWFLRRKVVSRRSVESAVATSESCR